MTTREVKLAVASFLDGAASARLSVPREEQRAIAERLVEGSYELGRKPRLLDGENLHALLTQVLLGRFKKKDPLAEAVPPVAAAWVEHLDATEVVPNAFELRTRLDAALDELLELVRTGANEPRAGRAAETVVHRAEKLGRNDPCFCGSGKKFKKCCGKGN